ncbi:MAG: ChbG/HpnK family deacetylase [Proteobacteria bacterium]|nr:ChbG/HpnK family deacetylase [Pseudomonadota bacterium]
MTKPMNATTIILCADDFGISSGVNKAILDLVAKGRLSAVSCMSLGPAWEEGERALKPLHDRASVGLHLTLTYLPPLVMELGERHPTEQRLLLQSWSRCLDRTLIEKELYAQFERFIKAWGAPPDFIDGHQHVHVLPVIRDIVLRLREQYAPQSWMRNVVDLTALTENSKYSILTVMGWRWLQLLRKHRVVHNRYMRGTYNYAQTVDYAALMQKWCSLKEPVLIYCHPGIPDAELAKFDQVLEPRQREYDFLNSDYFTQLNIRLVKHP